MTKGKIDYHNLVNYDQADPAKILAQKQGLETAKNMPFGFTEVDGTRGESAYVFDMGDSYGALVQEGLGTKSLIAQSVYEANGDSFFSSIAQDTVATVINDLVSVGATPVVLNAYWTSSSYDWLVDKKITTDFIQGWRDACDKAGVTWGGGETQSLPGIVQDGALEFAGCGFGVIKNRSHLVQDINIVDGDVIVFIESSGVHANGVSLTRTIASGLNDGYNTKLKDGSTFGESLLKPTILYAELLEKIRAKGVIPHYLSNITGHGWRKIMRAKQDFIYEIDEVPEPGALFDFIQDKSKNSTKEMYENYNMGVGYALYLSESDVDSVITIASEIGLKAWAAGKVKKGPKKLVINPLGMTFSGDSLEVR